MRITTSTRAPRWTSEQGLIDLTQSLIDVGFSPLGIQRLGQKQINTLGRFSVSVELSLSPQALRLAIGVARPASQADERVTGPALQDAIGVLGTVFPGIRTLHAACAGGINASESGARQT
jgi:hypothetical protein